MNYYKDNNSDDIYAYDDIQIEQVARMDELESLIKKEKPVYLAAVNSQRNAEIKINELTAALSNVGLSDEDIADIHQCINTESCKRDESINRQVRYAELTYEYQKIPDAFFTIRKNMQEMTELSKEAVDAITNPPVSHEQLVAAAEEKKQYLITEAATTITPLQDAVDLGMATPEEEALLKEWKKYRVMLNRVDTSPRADAVWPMPPVKP